MAGKTQPRLEDILRVLHAQLPDLRSRYGVRFLGIFGSRVRGGERRRSDLDVLVEFEDGSGGSFSGFVDLQDELSKILRLKVDLAPKPLLKRHIGRRILAEVIDVADIEPALAKARSLQGEGALRPRERDIRDYLEDILDAAANAESFTKGIEYEAWVQDTRTLWATLHALFIVGEAVARIPSAVRRQHPEVPWQKIVGLRNVIAHVYFGLQLPRVWTILHEDLPILRDTARRMLEEAEAGDSHG